MRFQRLIGRRVVLRLTNYTFWRCEEMGDFSLASSRLKLRPLVDSDREELRSRVFAHPDRVRTLIGNASTVEKQHELVDDWYQNYAFTWEKYGYGMWGIFRKNDTVNLPDGMVGIIWVEHTEDEPMKCADLGYALTPEAWGKGVVTEAGTTVLDYVFDATDVVSVEALIFSKLNPGSVRVFQKLGGKFVGTEPAIHYIGKEWMGFTRQFDLWLIESASLDRLEDRVHDASYRIGMFAAEGVGDRTGSLQSVTDALVNNAELGNSSSARKTAHTAFESGFSAPGWERYRILREEQR